MKRCCLVVATLALLNLLAFGAGAGETAVPEPHTILFLGGALLVLRRLRRVRLAGFGAVRHARRTPPSSGRMRSMRYPY